EYLATIRSNCPYNNYTCKGNPIIQYYNILRNESQNEILPMKNILFKKVLKKPGCNIELLKDLFENNGTILIYEDDSKCNTIFSASSNKNQC
ncbi:16454_t:CDS:2, partial [Gigaspora rosea]